MNCSYKSVVSPVCALPHGWRAKRFDVPLAGLCLALPFLPWTACRVCAQSLVANAQLSAAAVGARSFDYTITLNNTSASTSSIETFWYAWQPGGGDYLPSSPLSVQPPAGWNAVITGGGVGDGYGLLFETSTAPLAPGSSLSFSFTSPDSPAAVRGNSPWYSGTPVGSSAVYSGHLYGATETLVVEPVPEPSTLSLLWAGGLLIGGLWLRRGFHSENSRWVYHRS